MSPTVETHDISVDFYFCMTKDGSRASMIRIARMRKGERTLVCAGQQRCRARAQMVLLTLRAAIGMSDVNGGMEQSYSCYESERKILLFAASNPAKRKLSFLFSQAIILVVIIRSENGKRAGVSFFGGGKQPSISVCISNLF